MQDESKSNQGANPAKDGLEALKKAIDKRQAYLSEALVQMGPDDLRKHLKLEYSEDWNRLYRSLISGGALRRMVLDYMPFFVDLVSSKGPQALRRSLRLDDPMFDTHYEDILALVGISHGALYSYVERNKDALSALIMRGEGKSIRKDLGITASRYDRIWGDLLEVLTGAVCDSYLNEHQLEDGLRSFTMLMNNLRTHRSLRSFKKMWEYKEA